MSFQTLNEENHNLYKRSDRISIGSMKIFMSLIVPFSELMKNRQPVDIYTGEESIPFENRDPLFKSILRKEFSNAIKEFSNTIKNLL